MREERAKHVTEFIVEKRKKEKKEKDLESKKRLIQHSSFEEFLFFYVSRFIACSGLKGLRETYISSWDVNGWYN